MDETIDGARYEQRSLLINAKQPFEMNVQSYRRKAAVDRKRGPGRPPAHATPKELEKTSDD